MLIELGGGTNPHPNASIVIDLHHPKNTPVQDAAVVPWLCDKAYLNTDEDGPLDDACADEVYASHFMEHVPRGQPLINVMNEAWRVLKPGGRFNMILPVVGWTNPLDGVGTLVSSWQPYSDPTHVNLWWFPEALIYFCEGPFKANANYGTDIWAQLGDWTDDPFVHPKGGWCVRGGWEGVASLIRR